MSTGDRRALLDELATVGPFVAYWLLWLDVGPVLRTCALVGAGLVLWRSGPKATGAVLAVLVCVHVGAILTWPLALPNHHFLLTWLAAAVALNRGGPSRADAARWLYVSLMFFAALQKVASPTFRDGSYLAWLTLDGGLFPILAVVPGWRDVTGLNQTLVGLVAYPPTLPQRVLVGPAAGLWLWGRGFGALIVLVEVVLCALAAWRPRGAAFPVLALAFVILLPLVRPEWVFAATLASLTGLACGASPWRRAFGVVSIALALSATLCS